MIQIRQVVLHNNHSQKVCKLQYRHIEIFGHLSDPSEGEKWSDWVDVPEIHYEHIAEENKK